MADNQPIEYQHEGIEGHAFFREAQAKHWEALGWTKVADDESTVAPDGSNQPSAEVQATVPNGPAASAVPAPAPTNPPAPAGTDGVAVDKTAEATPAADAPKEK